MQLPAVSVIVVSRARPVWLRRCLEGLAQLDYPTVEVVVVSDSAGLDAARDFRVKAVPFDEPNISAARNLGLQAAAGEIVAFIDDDSVPEPQWLRHLVAPIASGVAVGAGGYVIGRNGISLQWAARQVTPSGDVALDLKGTSPQVVPFAKTEGTNMALYRETLLRLGGFDPAFRFYMDETELNFRMGQLGLPIAIVPLAQVHHGFAAGAYRRADRVPLTLAPVGRSLHHFLRKAGVAPDDIVARLAEERAAQVTRLARLKADPALIVSFDDGVAEGGKLPITALPLLQAERTHFLRFPTKPDAPHFVLIAHRWNRHALERAKAIRAGDATVTLIQYSWTARRHRARFVDGIWLQTGGLFGKSDRAEPHFRFWTRAKRRHHEKNRLCATRMPENAKIPSH